MERQAKQKKLTEEDEKGKEQTAGEGDDDILLSLERNKVLQMDMRNMFSQFVQAMDQQQSMMSMEEIQEKLKKNKALSARVEELEGQLVNSRDEKSRTEQRAMMEIQKLEKNLENVGKDLEVQLLEARKVGEKLKETMEERDSFRLQLLEAREGRARAERSAESAVKKAERATAEVAELHEAMRALHAEMSAVQRELDEATAQREQLQKEKIAAGEKTLAAQREAVKLRGDIQDMAAEVESLRLSEQRAASSLAELNTQSNVIAESLQRENTGLQKEIGELRELNRRATSTNNELNSALASAQQEIAGLRQSVRDAVREKQEAEIERDSMKEEAERAVGVERAAAAGLQQVGIDLQRLQSQEQAARKEALVHEKNHQQALGLVRQLEAEKRDLAFDLERKQHELQQECQREEALRSQLEGLRLQLAEAGVAAEQAKAREEQAVDDKEGMRSDLDTALHTVELLREEITGLQQEKEALASAGRDSSKENAARMVEYSQKISKLNADLAAARGEVEKAETQRERQKAELEGLYGQVGQARGESARCQKRVQELEEIKEELEMKMESLRAQVDDAKEGEHRMRQDFDQRLKQRDLQAQEELTRLRSSMNEEMRQKLAELEAQRQQAQQNLERAATDSIALLEKKAAEERAQKDKEIAQLKGRVAALANAMASLQEELHDAEAQNDQLRNLQTAHHSDERQGQTRDQLLETVEKLSKDLTILKTSSELELCALRRQLKVASQNKQGLDRLLLEADAKVENERAAREAAEEKLERLEQTLLQTQLQQNEASEMLKKMERSRIEMEQRFQGALQSRDVEVQRLKRRNQMLNDTVSRLTVGGGVPGLEEGTVPSVNMPEETPLGLSTDQFLASLKNQSSRKASSGDNFNLTLSVSPKQNRMGDSSSVSFLRYLQPKNDDADNFEQKPPTPILMASQIAPMNQTDFSLGNTDVDTFLKIDSPQDGNPQVLRGAAAIFASKKKEPVFSQPTFNTPVGQGMGAFGSPIETQTDNDQEQDKRRPRPGRTGPGEGIGGGNARSVSDRVAQALAERAKNRAFEDIAPPAGASRPLGSPHESDFGKQQMQVADTSNESSVFSQFPNKLRTEVELGKSSMLINSPQSERNVRQPTEKTQGEIHGGRGKGQGGRARAGAGSKTDMLADAYGTAVLLSSQSDRAGSQATTKKSSKRRTGSGSREVPR